MLATQQEDKAFHCLTVEEWAKITSILTYSETKVLYYLLSQNPMGDRSIDCRVRTIAEVMKISVGSVSSALKQLEAKGLIESMQIVRAEITIKPLLMSKNAEDYVARQRGKVVHSTEQQVHSTEQQVHSTEHGHNKERARAKTLKTDRDLSIQEGEIKNSECAEIGSADKSCNLVNDKIESTKEVQNPELDRSSAPATAPLKNSVDPFYYRRPKPNENHQSAPLEIWEVAKGQPYPYFWQWLALQYRRQGGTWAEKARSNAYAEMYNNRQRTTNALWQEFLEFANLSIDNAIAIQKSGVVPTLPSCFSDQTPVSESEVAAKLQAVTTGTMPLLQKAEGEDSDRLVLTSTDAKFCASVSTPETSEVLEAEEPDYALLSQNYSQMCRLGMEQVKNRMSMQPISRREVDTDSLIGKYRSWLKSGAQFLVKEAIAKVQANPDLVLVYDDAGEIPIDVDVAF